MYAAQVYFAHLRRRDVLRLFEVCCPHFAPMCVLQNFHEPFAHNFSHDNKRFIFAQIYKRWLFLSSAAHPCSLYFAVIYRLVIICPACKKSKNKTLSSQPQQTYTKKQNQKYSNPKNRRVAQWSHFLSRSNSSTHHVASSIFLRECAQAERVASQPHNKKLCSLFLKCLCLLWYILYYALLP